MNPLDSERIYLFLRICLSHLPYLPPAPLHSSTPSLTPFDCATAIRIEFRKHLSDIRILKLALNPLQATAMVAVLELEREQLAGITPNE